MRAPDAYFLCATPRTGSTLLCGLLRASGVAGCPQSYFRAQDRDMWAARWGLAPGYAFADYLRAARAAGRGPGGGPFAARVMWDTMGELVAAIAQGLPCPRARDGEVLAAAFGACRFVWLRREDAVAQAVSLLRAEQSGVWHTTDAAPRASRPVRYNFGALRARVEQVEAHAASWAAWFRANGIAPHALTYEALARDPAGQAQGVLGFLGLTLPPGACLSADVTRMADARSAAWAGRYRAQRG